MNPPKKINLPKGKYVEGIEINDADITIKFKPRLKIALLFISLNERYWPYLDQVMEDCHKNFLPQHNVDYFVWSDMPEDRIKNATVIPTEPIEWPHPTLMRYHLFLQKEEELKKYDHIFYLDADMRVVDKISDEVISDGLLAAEHPMYSLRKQYIPPYEPNIKSTAYIPRIGAVIDDNGHPRFKPFYLAGGFQGGKAKEFIKAMKVMKKNIDKDFNNNYTAIWNDESHWNRYLFSYKGPLSVMPPSYVYPDSLIKEYYEPIWGCSYAPKIVTLTKPFSLSKEGGSAINEFLGKPTQQLPKCSQCGDLFDTPGQRIKKIIHCPGAGKPHQMDLENI